MSYTREQLEELFTKLDTNGDGKLDVNELETLLVGPNFNFDADKAHQVSLVSIFQFSTTAIHISLLIGAFPMFCICKLLNCSAIDRFRTALLTVTVTATKKLTNAN